MAVSFTTLPGLARPFPLAAPLMALVDAIARGGGRPLAVGGAVRDHLLGTPAHDVDVEVYGLDLLALENALKGFRVHAVGRAFGVLKVDVEHAGARTQFDVALPRTESKVRAGHRGFVVASDPHLDPAAAAARRDFTLNAIAVDLLAQAQTPQAACSTVLVDPHNGVTDLAAGVLRHVSDAFDEDPLRVLRAAQFTARFGLTLHHTTVARCIALKGELSTLAAERIYGELAKLCLKARFPSLGLLVLQRTEALGVLFPELLALVDCPQEPEWHPEGSVWLHTLLVVDESARIADEERLPDDERLRLVLGALCHDLGKPSTTELVDGKIRSRDHESAGEAPARAFLGRMAAPHALVDDVVALVRDHLKPHQLWRDRAKIGDGALRRLALRVPLLRLERVARADFLGRTTPDALSRVDEAGAWLLSEAARLDTLAQKPAPILLGRHLVTRGFRPGPRFKAILQRAFDAQLEGAFADESGALHWLAASGEQP